MKEPGAPPEDALAVYDAYRSSFDAHLRSLVEVIIPLLEEFAVLSVNTRLKQSKSVVAKLRRHPTTLSTIEDVGGCRIVVSSMLDTRGVIQALADQFDIVRLRDYQTDPRAGYRSCHLVGQLSERHRVEIQVRTEIQNEWANLSEDLAHRVDPEVKYGGGPPTLRSALEDLSSQGAKLDSVLAGLLEMLPENATIWPDLLVLPLRGSSLAEHDIEFSRRMDQLEAQVIELMRLERAQVTSLLEARAALRARSRKLAREWS